MSHASNEKHDRRATQRHSTSIPCSFCCRDGSYSGITENLSINGAFVASDESPPQGSIGTLFFESEGGIKLKMLSRIVHTEGSSQVEGFGLCFVYFGEGYLDLFEALTSK